MIRVIRVPKLSTFVMSNPDKVKRVIPFFVLLVQITFLLWSPALLIASNKPDYFNKQQFAKYGFIENKGQIIDQNYKPNPSFCIC